MNRPVIASWILLVGYVLVFAQFGLSDYTGEKLIQAGAVLPALVVDEPWRLVTAAFAHIGILHLLFNGYFLYQVGPLLERELGLERFVILYVASAVGGNVAVCMLYPAPGLVAGGSTALFGMMGALLAMALRRERSYRDFFDSAAGRSVAVMIVANLVIGWIVPFISNTGHIGGLVAGFLLTFLCFKLPTAGGRPQRPPLLPVVATWALLVSTTWFAVQPVTRLWYQVREAWVAERERAEAVRGALEARGFSKNALRFLESCRRFREGFGSEEDRAIIGGTERPDLDIALAQAGVHPRVFDRFLTKLFENDRDAAEALPDDPWVDTARGY